MQVDRLVLKCQSGSDRWQRDSLKAQISGGKAALLANALRTTRSTCARQTHSQGNRAADIDAAALEKEQMTVKTWNLAPFLGGAPFQAEPKKRKKIKEMLTGFRSFGYKRRFTLQFHFINHS